MATLSTLGIPGETKRNMCLIKSDISNEELLLPKNLDAMYSEWKPGIDPIFPDAFKVCVETAESLKYDDNEE
jgi:hypothetical protein